MGNLALRMGRSMLGSAILIAAVAALAMAYTSSGGTSRESLVAEMLSNFILVLGIQIFIGNTGVLSFGHMAFAQIAAYATAVVAIPLAAKAKALPDIPFGLDDVHMNPFAATVFAVVITLIVGSLLGVAVARAKGLAPTMITLALLFVVDQLVKNWKELTRGAGGLSGIPRIEGNGWLYVGALVALITAHFFQETRIGRFSIATREDELAAPALGIRLLGREPDPRLVRRLLEPDVVVDLAPADRLGQGQTDLRVERGLRQLAQVATQVEARRIGEIQAAPSNA